ncbi:MAG: hypothetical protein ACMUIS_12540 [bacterium]
MTTIALREIWPGRIEIDSGFETGFDSEAIMKWKDMRISMMSHTASMQETDGVKGHHQRTVQVQGYKQTLRRLKGQK